MKVRNKRIYASQGYDLKTLKEEYEAAGFDTALARGVLTVFALKRRKPKQQKKPTRRS